MIRLESLPIGNLVETVSTWNPLREDPAETFQYIDLSAVDQEAKTITGAREITCSEAPSRARQVVKNDDILVSTVRPNLNGVAKVPTELNSATASTGFCVLRPKTSMLCSNYLFHWVKSPQFVADMVSKASGASYPAVSDKIVLASSLPYASLPEQRRIAAILDQADALRAKRREALAQLDSLTQSIFIEMFGDPKTNPKSIQKASLGSLLKLKSGEFLPSTAMVISGNHPVFGGNGINGYHDEFMFDSRKIVIGRVGVYCGCVHVTPAQSWVTDNALYVSERDSAIEFDFLAFALKQAQLNQYASQSAQPLISGSRIYPVEILVPPKAEQLEFIARAERVAGLARDNIESAKALDELFSSLQHRAFRGEL